MGINDEHAVRSIEAAQTAIWNTREDLRSLSYMQDFDTRRAVQRGIDYLTNAREALMDAQERLSTHASMTGGTDTNA